MDLLNDRKTVIPIALSSVYSIYIKEKSKKKVESEI